MHRRSRQLVVLAVSVCALALLVPGSAIAAPLSFGSPLTAGASGLFGCETKPTLEPVNFDYVPAASGAADCTWRQSGVFGDITSTRGSSVPGDGVITQVEVLSGANPAPLSFVIFRQLGTGGFAGQCCFFVSETPAVQPAPNTISTFPVQIPVQRNTLNGIQATDHIAISAPANGGTLPIRQVGSTNSFQFTAPGSLNSGFFYPRIGSIPNDSGGGRLEEGVSGFELLIRTTWCGTGDPTCRAAVLAQSARVARGRALIRLICNGNTACEGNLALLSSGALTAANSKTVTYGKAKYKLSAGGKSTIKLKLNRKGKSLLKKKSRAKVVLRISPTVGAPVSSKFTLKRR